MSIMKEENERDKFIIKKLSKYSLNKPKLNEILNLIT